MYGIDKTTVRKQFGTWYAHCNRCDLVCEATDFARIADRVRLHRQLRHTPPSGLPRRIPGTALAALAADIGAHDVATARQALAALLAAAPAFAPVPIGADRPVVPPALAPAFR